MELNQPVAAEHSDGRPRVRRLVTASLWWLATLTTLVVLDDLAFGPVFWAISRLAGAPVGFIAVLVVYIPAQVAIVWRGTSGQPGRVASFFLHRLNLERRSSKVRVRENRLREHVRGTVSSSLLSLVIGGVIPPMLLWRAGYPVVYVRRLAPITATIYAVEFALLHGLLPGLL